MKSPRRFSRCALAGALVLALALAPSSYASPHAFRLSGWARFTAWLTSIWEKEGPHLDPNGLAGTVDCEADVCSQAGWDIYPDG